MSTYVVTRRRIHRTDATARGCRLDLTARKPISDTEAAERLAADPVVACRRCFHPITPKRMFPSRTPAFYASRKGRAQRAALWARQKARRHGAADERVSTAYFERLYGEPCTYCGLDPAEGADHVVPLARGGANSEANLVSACEACNRAKLFHTPEEWRAGTVVRVRTYTETTHCKRGHERTVHGSRKRDGSWRCRACDNARHRLAA